MKKPLAIGLVVVVAAAVAAAGVGAYGQRDLVSEALTHEKSYAFADRAAQDAYQASRERPFRATEPRAWMADDATDIRIRFVTTEKPGWDVGYRSRTGLTPELLSAGGCTPVASAPRPALAVDWLPSDPAGTVSFCSTDQSYVVQAGDSVFGWQAADAKLYPLAR
jgi:hypothetical protein